MSIPVSTFRRRQRTALNQNDDRPKQGETDIVGAAILNCLIRYLHPEVGNLSWVSHGTIAAKLGLHKQTVRCHLLAQTLIGSVRVRYRTARVAHNQTTRFYPNYTKHTDGKTFQEMPLAEPTEGGKRRPKVLNYYTIHGCMGWAGYKGETLPAWQSEVIRLCASQDSANIAKAKRLAAKNRILNGRGRPAVYKPASSQETPLNDRADPAVYKPASSQETPLNDRARPAEPLLSEDARRLFKPDASPTVRSEPEVRSEQTDIKPAAPAWVHPASCARCPHPKMITSSPQEGILDEEEETNETPQTRLTELNLQISLTELIDDTQYDAYIQALKLAVPVYQRRENELFWKLTSTLNAKHKAWKAKQ